MSGRDAPAGDETDPAAALGLDQAASDHLADRLSAFVDTKLLLGYRYNDWVHGVPSMEDANAVQGQAANEFGQANHFMTALEALGFDDEAYLARDTPGEYRNLQVLDSDPGTWPAFLAAVGFADMATQVRLGAMSDSAWDTVAEPAGKAVQEEEFHTQYLVGALKSYVVDDEAMTERFLSTLEEVVPTILHWFGRDHDDARALVEAGVVEYTASEERRIYLSRVDDYVQDVFGTPFEPGGAPADALLEDLDWTDWDAERFRLGGGGPERAAVDVLSSRGIEESIA